MNWRKPFIFGVLNLVRSQIPACFRLIQQYEFEDRKTMQERQDKKLEALLIHAYQQVPYYREVLSDCGVVVDNNVHLERFSSMPLLTKGIVRAQGKNLYATDREQRRPYENTSGGSTGEPLVFIQDRQYDAWNIATKLYFNRALGKDVGQAEIKFWGSDRDILAGNLTIKDRLINGLYNRRFFNSYRLGQVELEELIALNNCFKPKAYWSYMESAHELAKYLARHPQAFHSPQFVISTIGPLTDDIRTTIEMHMKCKVYNQYGSREVGAIACQCLAQQGMHTFPWWNVIEVLDQNDCTVLQGEGRVIVTTLENYSMPLIRYDIGDVAVARGFDCSCGRSSFQLGTVMGRTLGYFKKPDGSLAHSHFLVQVLFHRNWIKRFKIIQDEIDHILIQIEKEPSASIPQDDLRDIVHKTQVLMESSCRVDFEYVSEISRTASDKFVYTECRLS